MRRGVAKVLALALIASGVLGLSLVRAPHDEPGPSNAAVVPERRPVANPPSGTADDDPTSCDPARELVLPLGGPAGIRCATARSIIAEVHARFAAEVPTPRTAAFADLVVSWLDPHGLWSDAPDAPPGARIAKDAAALLAEIEVPKESSEPCAHAHALGRELVDWVAELGAKYDRARASARRPSRPEATTLALVGAFEDGPVTTPASELAAELGSRVGAIEHALGDDVTPFTASLRERYLPSLSAEEWQEVVLAAAVRAYVSAVDPHGAWAPIDEEWALYADDESFEDGSRLWGDMVRTPIGARIVDRPRPPLAVDDLVLEVSGVTVGGLSVEELGQLERVLPADPEAPRRVTVLRAGYEGPLSLEVPPYDDAPDAPGAEDQALLDDDDDELDLDLVRYGARQAAIVGIHYIGDDLGERLEELVEELSEDGEPPAGLLLDLRGNGGGSTDGAAAALGVVLPGVPAFPLLHGGHLTEVLTTPVPGPSRRFAGPVGVLVDADTASAAEMLAGAIDRYGRGTLLGARTFGKGCVQEYFRDHTGSGALRLTTQLFVLPDGSPIQTTGLLPALSLDVERGGEKESDLPGALPPVTGPDVRVRIAVAPSWPRPVGRVGPCGDPVICSALRKLAGRSPVSVARAGVGAKNRRNPR